MPPKPIPESISEVIIQALDRILPGLRKHSERVSLLSVETGRQLGFSERSLETLWLAARLHDIGILTNVDAISVLSQKVPVDIGKVIHLFNPTAITIVAAAHQIWLVQGGYDLNRQGMISLSASIVAAAELYDNARKGLKPFPRIVSRRNLEYAMVGIVGTRFDPRVVPLIFRVARQMGVYDERRICTRHSNRLRKAH